ncbi:hypothetical protein CMQ_286 [Grosmannia clavigera kw1407]|uniref:Uncharacterized protein n=1 Tax=Grosmannia clavigera (strain kw1407 / UAMH 11150) TaxID=655863 RepID=F0XQW8_GROCL|nr:uncharacterized protein CMQ_286 [Grosmannia clavigera kw1407]EFW99968.1 hypothetical protein CMQ_286 [Grosmannia clavigera kw1407]
MLGTSVPELVFIRVCVFLLQYSIPLCVITIALLRVAFAQNCGVPLILTKVFAGLLVLDLSYAVLLYRPFKSRLRASANHPQSLTLEERSELFERCLASISDPERYLQLWFLGAGPQEIKRENVKDFILWAFFDRKSVEKTVEGDVESCEDELESYVVQTEEMLGRPLPPGRGTAVPLRLTFDVVDTRYRSVVWYAIVSLVDGATHCMLLWHGFQLRVPSWRTALGVFPWRPELLIRSVPGYKQVWKDKSPSDKLSYWYRPHISKTTLPVVFIHGIGIGLYPYTTLLAEIPKETGVIALEILWISMRLYAKPLTRDDFLHQVRLIVSYHGWDRFVLVSHSYGSVLTTHILRSPMLARKVSSVVLVDPVSICLHLPDVAYNFTRRPPHHANEWMLWYFASMDPGTALSLGRHFFWKENLIWKEELVALPSDAEMVVRKIEAAGERSETRNRGVTASSERQDNRRNVAIVLSGRDLIVNTMSVARYLLCEGDLGSSMHHEDEAAHHFTRGSMTRNCVTKDGIELLWFPKLDHSQVFDTATDRSQVIAIIERYCSSR